jgi:hypothetical protein
MLPKVKRTNKYRAYVNKTAAAERSCPGWFTFRLHERFAAAFCCPRQQMGAMGKI